MYSICRTNCLVTILIRTLLDIEDVLDMICFIDRLFYRYINMYEYNTLDANVYDETDFWTIRSYYFQIPPLVSLTDVLMTLLILITRYRDDIMFRCVNMIPLTLTYTMGQTFGLLGTICSGSPIDELN